MKYEFSCTPVAIGALRARSQFADNFTGLLRVGVSGSAACAGFRYVIQFDNVIKANQDLTFLIEDLLIVIDPRSMQILNNTVLDFEKTLQEQKFVFRNPQAEKTCGCGESFSLGDRL